MQAGVTNRVRGDVLMRSKLALAGVVGAVALGGAGAALAGDHSQPPDPGSPGCHGQGIAYINAFFRDRGVNGLGNIGRASDLTVQQIQDIVDAFCNS